MQIDLSGKVAVVTGAAQGIGRAISLVFAEHGANIVALDIKTAEAKKVIEEISKFGRTGLAYKVDVSNSSEVNSAINQVIEEYGRIDIMVNNAGIYPESLVVDMAEEEWDSVINISLKGTFNCSKAVARHMIDQKYGRIINLSSRAGRQGSIGHAHYAAAKAGIIGFTMSLARELGPYGITANTLAPGVIETDMTKDILKKGGKKMSDYIVGRYGKPEDLIGVALLLASDYSSYITGATIDVNGGSWMG
jgi:3-oxoacyl-[acyl-carrier protein] reductase